MPEDSSVFASFVVSIDEAEALIVGIETVEGLIGEVITDEGVGVDLDVVD